MAKANNTPKKRAAAKLASKKGVELRGAQGRQTFTSSRMSDSVRRQARDSLRQASTTARRLSA